MLKTCSHIVLTSPDVTQISLFFSQLFELTPYHANDEFTEFVFPSGFRLAFFAPVGKASQFFACPIDRPAIGIGLTVDSVDKIYHRTLKLKPHWPNLKLSGPPKDHPWGEKSFLLIDPDSNRWEITQSPTQTGSLVNI